jgi:adenylate cyclase
MTKESEPVSPGPESAGMNPQQALDDVRRLLKGGDLLLAFDRACEHVERFPGDEALKHAGVLALARAGATDGAAGYFKEWGLDRSKNSDVLALEGRIAKDRALKLSGKARRTALGEAASAYRRVYRKEPRYYTAINWASLTFLAGDRAAATRIAKTVLADPIVIGGADYWALATRAEAKLVLGDLDSAREDLIAGAAKPDADLGAKSSTRRQLRLLLAEHGLDAKAASRFLAPLAPPPTVHFVDVAGPGQGWNAYRGKGVLAAARRQMRKALAELQPGAIFGSLGSPAEILFAEEVLKAGLELNVVLPLPEPAFVHLFVAAGGAGWKKRFTSCRDRAASVTIVSDDAYTEDASLADYAARVAMGLTLLRAQHLDGEATQVALDNGTKMAASSIAAPWLASGPRRRMFVRLETGSSSPPPRRKRRQCCAVIFGDMPGFSKLPEKYLPVFWRMVMGEIGRVLKEWGDALGFSNTWGDAIHLVIRDPREAARICLEIQERLAEIDGKVLGWKEAPTMRIGAHYGPVFEGWDPVAAEHTYYGRSLSRAARIEPITPRGAVYVTEAFAAILLLESHADFTCTYVGEVALAKGYGTFRMYDLKAVAPS